MTRRWIPSVLAALLVLAVTGCGHRAPASGGTIVHITRTGAKYHRAGCRFLSTSDIPIPAKDAKARGYAPCSVCAP